MDQEQQQIARSTLQAEAEQLSLENKHLLLEWATGTGKGKAVMQCIAASLSPKQWLIIVPEILQIYNYKEDLKKHGYEWMLGTKIVDIICYASFPKWENASVNICFNEAHHITELKYEIAKTIDFDQIVSDSATIPQEAADRLAEICPFYKFSVDMACAISLGILPEPAIYIISIKLDDKLKKHPVKYGQKEFLVTDFKRNQKYETDIKYWQNKIEEEELAALEQSRPMKSLKWMETKILRLGGERKKFLAECKEPAVIALMYKLIDRRSIWFCGSKEQSDVLGKSQAVNSGKSKKANEKMLSDFNSLKENHIFVYRMGKEGWNLFMIECGVIIQLDSGMDDGLAIIQRIGRTMRATDPNIYIFVAQDTQDEKYLERALIHIDKKYIKKFV